MRQAEEFYKFLLHDVKWLETTHDGHCEAPEGCQAHRLVEAISAWVVDAWNVYSSDVEEGVKEDAR